MLIPTGWIASLRSPGMSNVIFLMTSCFTGSMTLTVPPTSDETQSSEPSCLNSAKRGRASTRTLATISARVRVDEMRHVGRFRRVDQGLAVRTNPHAFRLDADLHLAKAAALLHVDDRDGIVVLVGDVEDLAGRILGEQFGIGARGQYGDDLPRDLVSIIWIVSSSPTATRTNLPSLVNVDAARPLADLDGVHHLQLVRIDRP